MTWTAALTTGAGLGLIHFGGLWLTVLFIRRPDSWRLIALSLLARLTLAGLVFYALSRQGAGSLLFGLVGFWLVRGSLLARLGGVRHG
jgi:F1F0 ATPase subunit 2